MTSKTQKKSDNKFDVIIIGGGVAGISTALWCEELGLQTLLLEEKSELGGQLLIVYNPINNYLGTETQNGRELQEKFLSMIKKRKVKIRTNSKVVNVDLQNKSVVLADGKTFSAKALVMATGVSRRISGIEDEKKFIGKGILESGKRDAEKVFGRTVCIIGGGDAALENVMILSETAKKIYLIHRRKKFRARPEFIGQLLKNPKVEILTETIVKKICGKKSVEAIETENLTKKKKQTLNVDFVLIRIGVKPNTELFVNKLKLDKQGYIRINSNCETSCKGIYAVGDIANPISPTVSTAVGTGAIAAKKIFSEIDKIEK